MTPCSACGAPYHPVTGHVFTDKTHLYGPRTRDMIAWVKSHVSRRWGKMRFYDHASTSIRPKKEES